MNFELRNLSVLAYAQGFTLWHYRSEPGELISMNGYFDSINDMIASGDVMLVSSKKGSKLVSLIQDSGKVRAVPIS